VRTGYLQAGVKTRAIEWARGLLANPTNFVILDTETTGLDSFAEVVQISVIDGKGNVLVNNQLIKPTVGIDSRARAVHGIGEDALVNAPTFAEFLPTLLEVINGRL